MIKPKNIILAINTTSPPSSPSLLSSRHSSHHFPFLFSFDQALLPLISTVTLLSSILFSPMLCLHISFSPPYHTLSLFPHFHWPSTPHRHRLFCSQISMAALHCYSPQIYYSRSSLLMPQPRLVLSSSPPHGYGPSLSIMTTMADVLHQTQHFVFFLF